MASGIGQYHIDQMKEQIELVAEYANNRISELERILEVANNRIYHLESAMDRVHAAYPSTAKKAAAELVWDSHEGYDYE